MTRLTALRGLGPSRYLLGRAFSTTRRVADEVLVAPPFRREPMQQLLGQPRGRNNFASTSPLLTVQSNLTRAMSSSTTVLNGPNLSAAPDPKQQQSLLQEERQHQLPLTITTPQHKSSSYLLWSRHNSTTLRKFSSQPVSSHDGTLSDSEDDDADDDGTSSTPPPHHLRCWLQDDYTGMILCLEKQHPHATPALTQFHAAWLWENDPTYIHPSSGQRTRGSLTAFYAGNWQMQSAAIVMAEEEETEAKNGAAPAVVRPVPGPPGCVHPSGSVYHDNINTSSTTSTANNNNTVQQRWLLRVEWQGHTHHNDDQDNDDTIGAGSIATPHKTSYYDVDWLWRCRYDDEAIRNRQAAARVDKTKALRAGDGLWEERYCDLVQPNDDDNDEPLYRFLSAIVKQGAALVQPTPDPSSLPSEDVPVAAVARRLTSGGQLSHGNLYGDLFDVIALANAENIAYTTVELGAHQDLAYYESPPGLQLLHCLQNDGTGGESRLIDAMAAATEFQTLCPDLFEILTRYEATFFKQRAGADMMYRRSHIRTDAAGQVVSVHWSPPFEGPLLGIPAQALDDFYVARTAFGCMLDPSLSRNAAANGRRRLLPMLDAGVETMLTDYAHEYTWEHRLRAGELLVFNNLRMLHGRNAFDLASDNNNNSGGRHLQGCYINIDDTLNQYRLLRQKRLLAVGGSSNETDAATTPHPSVGNGSSHIL